MQPLARRIKELTHYGIESVSRFKNKRDKVTRSKNKVLGSEIILVTETGKAQLKPKKQ